MELYKYLPKEEFILTWIDGGIIPLKLASTFLSTQRDKTQTPDENREIKLKTKLSDKDYKERYRISPFLKSNIRISNNVTERNGIVDKSTEFIQKMVDGYVMSFSTKLSKIISDNFEMPFAIKITNLDLLRNTINSQLSFEFEEGLCEYTEKIDRGIFLKGIEDAWQNEYRFFWKISSVCKKEIKIEIPKNIAKVVEI